MNQQNPIPPFEALPSYSQNPDNIPSYDESVANNPIRIISPTLSPLSARSSISQTSIPPTRSSTSTTHSIRTPTTSVYTNKTLVLLPSSTLIAPLYPAPPRPLYELTQPLTDCKPPTSIFLAEIPSVSPLTSSNHLYSIEKRHHLYRVFETNEGRGGKKYTLIDGRKMTCCQRSMLRRNEDRQKLVATNEGITHGDNGEAIFYGKIKGEVVEWLDVTGKVIARDWMVGKERRGEDGEKLEILMEIEKRGLDMLVACWVGRIQQDVLKEEEEERKERNGVELVVKEPGMFSALKEKLGIGHGMRRFADARPPTFVKGVKEASEERKMATRFENAVI